MQSQISPPYQASRAICVTVLRSAWLGLEEGRAVLFLG